MLTRFFISNLHDKHVTLARVNFIMSTDIITASTGIPNVGEIWFKQGNLNHYYYKPYLKPRYKNDKKENFPFSQLLDRYVPMMKIIMKYSHVREGFLGSIPIISDSSCTSLGLECFVYPIIST